MKGLFPQIMKTWKKAKNLKGFCVLKQEVGLETIDEKSSRL
jgi:hypothetical protein